MVRMLDLENYDIDDQNSDHYCINVPMINL